MTQRERPTPDAARATPACAAGPSAPSLPPAGDRNGCSSLWEDLFQRATPAQQQDLLALAARQGVVYAHQVAPAANSNAQSTRRTLLPALLNGQTKDLDAAGPPPLETIVDAALDGWQRQAVARAMHTPDICLIQGTPGTGKSRVVAEIVLQAARRGERVLLVAPAAAALDRVLQQLAGNQAVCPIRCLAADETLDGLPGCIRRLTLQERQRHFQEYTLPAARQAAESVKKRLRASRQLEAVFADMERLLGEYRRTLSELQVLGERRAGMAAVVEAEFACPTSSTEIPSSLKARWADLAKSRDAAADRIEAQLAVVCTDEEKGKVECERVAEELAPLTPLHEARRHNRWWSRLWWRARGEKNLAERVDQLQDRRQALAQQAAANRQEIDRLQAERRQVEEQFRSEEECLSAEEVARRQAEIDARVDVLSKEQRQLEDHWRLAVVAVEGGAAVEISAAGLQAARERWAGRLRFEEQQRDCAEGWARGVEEVLATLPQRLAACANAVAVTTSSLANDPHFGERSGITFDLLILEEAEQVTESEFVNLARRACRWVLVGQPMPEADNPAALPRRSHPAKPLRPAALRPGFFQRLWNTLHGDPRRLPYRWLRREGRLACCLHPIPPDLLQYVEKEHVADQPDIELCIVAPPRRPSYLAEVVFPAAMTIHEAKEYIFRELGELSVQAQGHSLRWYEGPDRITLNLSADTNSDTVPVPLEPGMCELVGALPAHRVRDGAAPWHTSGLAFDRAAGWTLERATRWVETHLKARDLGRTAFLPTPYRMHARLAQVLDDLLFEESNPADCPRYAGLPCDLAELSAVAPVEFVPVPAGWGDTEPRRPGDGNGGWGGSAAVAARPRAVKGGAGFEIDLADPRRLDPLPQEFRALLPATGLVNYLEAQAIVRTLEQLVSDPALRLAGANRPAAPCEQRGANGSCAVAGCALPSHCPVVAVVALYPAQAELLRLLIARSTVLARSDVPVEVGAPAAFRQRECLIALVSLTRSHTHRAVSLGDGPQALVQALTRATGRLLLFGDPGTLLRRSQWTGELDHLEECDALKERDFAGRLVRYIQGQGAHAHGFQLREGSGA